MKTIDNSAIIASASAIIAAAALEAVTAIMTAKAKLTVTIREQVTLLEKAGVPQKEIATIVREAVNGAASAAHISKVLVSCGIRLRGKRSDAGFLRMADGALVASMEAKPAAVASDDGDDGDSDDSDSDSDSEAGGGHTAETLAALLASLDPDLVAAALEIAGLA
jgi:hypothetical protein